MQVPPRIMLPYWRELYDEDQVSRLTAHDQLRWLEDYRGSGSHHSRTPTTYYGVGDPRRASIASCSHCQSEDAEVARNAEHTYAVTCPDCQARGPSAVSALKAVIGWNLEHGTDNYRRFPYFGLEAFEPDEALDRLTRIYDDIQLRLEICRVQRTLGKSAKIARHQKLLQAYREQVNYARALIQKSEANEPCNRRN